jgi:hypothetical protein
VTAADLSDLREWMVNHEALTHYSDEFRAACRAAIKAIDIAAIVDSDDDGQLSRALREFVAIGRNEIFLQYAVWSESIH